MKTSLPTLFLLGCICLLQLGCASPKSSSPKSTHPPAQVSEWETRLSGYAGTLNITFNLPQQAAAELYLSDQPIRIKYGAPVRIALDNENCTLGHLVSVNHLQGSDFLFKYFSQEARWNHSNTLTLNWTTDRKMTITLNEEIIHIDTPTTLRHLKIASSFEAMTIEHFEYTPQQ
ncbi:hypothetical protein [Cellvibrio sp. pealriver]|uniref:hypothetical protein n=1 Tax=Cellvibrio sp. pealriver TaxID=1622269 RepID=UPI00066FCC86|nr:hypothetical protein [Cellvibrio sp. pealriver]